MIVRVGVWFGVCGRVCGCRNMAVSFYANVAVWWLTNAWCVWGDQGYLAHTCCGSWVPCVRVVLALKSALNSLCGLNVCVVVFARGLSTALGTVLCVSPPACITYTPSTRVCGRHKLV